MILITTTSAVVNYSLRKSYVTNVVISCNKNTDLVSYMTVQQYEFIVFFLIIVRGVIKFKRYFQERMIRFATILFSRGCTFFTNFPSIGMYIFGKNNKFSDVRFYLVNFHG